MAKNLTIRSLILILTFVFIAIFSIALFAFQKLEGYVEPSIAWLILISLLGLSIYLFLQYALNNFMYRRIKLIYKMIRSSKVSLKNEDLHVSKALENLSEVESQVQDYVVKQQKEIETLKELEEYRKNFLGNISHELKTPIFSVQGYIHTLLDGGLNDDQVNRRFLQKAASNIERLETVVNDLEIIAKLEDATMQLDLQGFDIKELSQEVIDQVEVQARQSNINVGFKSGADRSFFVEADREYIRTVLINLVVNSIKYGRENGITGIGFYDMENYILVEVADNGIGIENKHLRHLFDRFYRVDKSRSRQGGGSGLGLSIVKHILEAHGQTINVRSTPGLGTTIGFTLKKARNSGI